MHITLQSGQSNEGLNEYLIKLKHNAQEQLIKEGCHLSKANISSSMMIGLSEPGAVMSILNIGHTDSCIADSVVDDGVHLA